MASRTLKQVQVANVILLLILIPMCGYTASSDVIEDRCTALHQKLVKYSAQATDRTKKFVFARPSEILNCTRSVPFDSKRDLGTLDSIIRVFRNFYSLLHVAKRSPDPSGLPSNYDVIKELEGLKPDAWSSAEEFYEAVSAAVDRLKDGHTGIDLSCPPFRHRLALPLVGVVEGGQHTVRTAPDIMLIPATVEASFLSPFEFDPTPYTGAKVLTIDGQDAWVYMVSWAEDNSNVYHNLGQKLNYAFAHLKWINGTRSRSYGAFGTRSTNPKADFVRLKLVRQGKSDPEDVDVPWLSYTPSALIKGFSSTSDYEKTFCRPKKVLRVEEPKQLSKDRLKQEAEEALQIRVATAEAISLLQAGKQSGAGLEVSKLKETQDGPGGFDMDASANRMSGGSSGVPESGEGLMREFPRIPLRMAKIKGTPRRFWMKGAKMLDLKLSNATQISGEEEYWKVYLLSDNKTTVVCISNFFPYIPVIDTKSFFNLLAFFIYETAKALYTADVYGERIILDVSRNGGGATILVPWLMELIVGSFKFPSPRSDMENFIHFLADTDLVRQLREKEVGSYSWEGWADTNEYPYDKTDKNEFFYPIKQLKFGANGDPGFYSSFFKEANPSLSELLEMPIHSAWGDKPFLLFSDGQCFSACSSFAISMKERFGVKLVTIGGISSKPMAFSAAGGGFVTEDVAEDVLKTIPKELRSSPDAPAGFGVDMKMSLRWTNGFVRENSPAPIEFTFVPGDHRIQYSIANIGDPSLQYLEAAKFF